MKSEEFASILSVHASSREPHWLGLDALTAFSTPCKQQLGFVCARPKPKPVRLPNSAPIPYGLFNQ